MDDILIGLAGGLMGMFGLGLSDFLAKKVVDQIGPLRTLLYAQLIGAVFLSLYLLKDSALPEISPVNLIKLVMFGAAFAGGYLAFYRGIEIGKVSMVSPISSSDTIVAAAVSFLFLHEAFSGVKLLALTLVIFGLLAASIDFHGLRLGRRWGGQLSRGVPYALVCMLAFGLFLPFWDHFLEQPGWMVLNIMVRLVMAMILIIFAVGIKKTSIGFKNKGLIPRLTAVGFFEALGAGGVAWGFATSSDTTSIVIAVSSAYSLVTAMLAFFILKERLARNQYWGVAMIVAGLFLIPLV